MTDIMTENFTDVMYAIYDFISECHLVPRWLEKKIGKTGVLLLYTIILLGGIVALWLLFDVFKAVLLGGISFLVMFVTREMIIIDGDYYRGLMSSERSVKDTVDVICGYLIPICTFALFFGFLLGMFTPYTSPGGVDMKNVAGISLLLVTLFTIILKSREMWLISFKVMVGVLIITGLLTVIMKMPFSQRMMQMLDALLIFCVYDFTMCFLFFVLGLLLKLKKN